jgi:hypothetical protein
MPRKINAMPPAPPCPHRYQGETPWERLRAAALSAEPPPLVELVDAFLATVVLPVAALAAARHMAEHGSPHGALTATGAHFGITRHAARAIVERKPPRWLQEPE